MKNLLISLTLVSLLLKSDGFNLNKLGRSSRYSRDNLQMVEPMDKGYFLLGQSREESRGDSGLDNEVFWGKGGNFLVG